MKNAILFHGSSSTPNSCWLPSVKQFLGKHGYKVWAPQLPKPEAPDLKIQLPFVLKDATFNNETIIIGHSSGCPLILGILEKINVKINRAILVAGYARKLEKMKNPISKKLEKDAEPILQKQYNWNRIRKNVEDIIFINSDNDPWGCDDKEGRFMIDNIGKGKLIIMKGEGHMGSDRFKQPYKKFPFLIKLLLD